MEMEIRAEAGGDPPPVRMISWGGGLSSAENRIRGAAEEEACRDTPRALGPYAGKGDPEMREMFFFAMDGESLAPGAVWRNAATQKTGIAKLLRGNIALPHQQNCRVAVKPDLAVFRRARRIARRASP